MVSSLHTMPLFAGLPVEELAELEKRSLINVRKYRKGQWIARSGTVVTSLMTVVEGRVIAEMVDSMGKTIKVEELGEKSMLAPAFLFGRNNQFPVDILAGTSVTLACITREELLEILSEHKPVLENYLNIISSRTQFLSRKIRMLSFQSLRGKVANYILQLTGGRKPSELTLPVSQQNMAELFGVTRPAVGRIMRKMDGEGYFTARGKQITKINYPRLEQLIR